MKEDKNTCNQCGQEMKSHLLGDLADYQFFYFCSNPECPNYALFQVPMKDMPKD